MTFNKTFVYPLKTERNLVKPHCLRDNPILSLLRETPFQETNGVQGQSENSASQDQRNRLIPSKSVAEEHTGSPAFVADRARNTCTRSKDRGAPCTGGAKREKKRARGTRNYPRRDINSVRIAGPRGRLDPRKSWPVYVPADIDDSTPYKYA